jgi:hypothetical protein
MRRTKPEAWLMNHNFEPNDNNLISGERPLHTIEAEPRPDLVAKYELFKDRIHPNADVVYHPCGGNDVSPSVVFPNSEVIYVDIDGASMNALAAKGYEAHTDSALEYDPGSVDVLILVNPSISPEVPSSHVREGGFVVCNDYHGTAEWLRRSGDYDLMAIVEESRRNELVFNDTHPDDYWKTVETDAEFQNARGSLNAVSYSRAAQIVEAAIGHPWEKVLEEYKSLIEFAKERDLQASRQAREAPVDPEALAFFGLSEQSGSTADARANEEELLPDEEGPWVITDRQGREVILTGLPRKTGRDEDIFIFQKKPRHDSHDVARA